MRIALLGYGRMGIEVEKVALERHHEVHLIVRSDNPESLETDEFKNSDIAIDFTLPEVARENILAAFKHGIPIVVGTTGWYPHLEELQEVAGKQNGTLFYAPNFSIGVNILFHINKNLASLMNEQEEYEPLIEEIHHTGKKDAPSGTAAKLAENLVQAVTRKDKWQLAEKGTTPQLPNDQFPVHYAREEGAIGMHRVNYASSIDELEIKHKAYNRRGFALGAVKAGEWVQNRQGVFTMENMLGL